MPEIENSKGFTVKSKALPKTPSCHSAVEMDQGKCCRAVLCRLQHLNRALISPHLIIAYCTSLKQCHDPEMRAFRIIHIMWTLSL